MKKYFPLLIVVIFIITATIICRAYQDRQVLKSWNDVIAFQSIKANWKKCEIHSDCVAASHCENGPTAIHRDFRLEFETYNQKRASLANTSCAMVKPDIDLRPACYSRQCQLASVNRGVENILSVTQKRDSEVQRTILQAHGLACQSEAIERITKKYESRMYQCSLKPDCAIADGQCGNQVAINQKWKESFEFLAQNATACKSCMSSAPLVIGVDCYNNRCVVETDKRVAEAHTLKVGFLENTEFVFYSDLWSVSFPKGINVGNADIVPMANSDMELPTITFNPDRTVSTNLDILPGQWSIDSEGQLKIGYKTFSYYGKYRAFFSPIQGKENLGLYIVRKDRVTDFKRIKSYKR